MLTPKQLRCIELLSSEVPQKDIAKELGVSERTIQRWLKLDEFQDALEGVSYRPVAVSAVDVVSSHKSRREKLDSLLDTSLDVLESVIINGDCKTSDRIRACQIVGDWQGITKLPDYDQALITLVGLGWLPNKMSVVVVEGVEELKEKIRQSLLPENPRPSIPIQQQKPA
jgi:Homeodomain-like domain